MAFNADFLAITDPQRQDGFGDEERRFTMSRGVDTQTRGPTRTGFRGPKFIPQVVLPHTI